MKVGDPVCFNSGVIKRTRHSEVTVGMRGIIVEISDRLAIVDTQGTYPKADGDYVRAIPLANLAKIAKNGAIIDLTI